MPTQKLFGWIILFGAGVFLFWLFMSFARR